MNNTMNNPINNTGVKDINNDDNKFNTRAPSQITQVLNRYGSAPPLNRFRAPLAEDEFHR